MNGFSRLRAPLLALLVFGIAAAITWVFFSGAFRTEAERAVDRYLGEARRNERNERPPFLWLQAWREAPAPLSSLAESILGHERDQDQEQGQMDEVAAYGLAVVPPLVKALTRDRSPAAQAAAAEALGKQVDPAASQALVQALAKDPVAMVRSAAAAALGKQPPADSLPALTQALEKDPDPAVRQSAAAALRELDSPNVDAILLGAVEKEKDANTRMLVFDQLQLQGKPELVQTLIDLLGRRPDPDTQMQGAEALGKAGDLRAVPALIHLLESSTSGGVKRAAGEALGKLGDRTAVPALATALKALRPTGPPEAAPSPGPIPYPYPAALRQRYGIAARQGDAARWDASHARQMLTTALGQLGAPEAAAALRDTLLQDPDTTVRVLAVQALGRAQEAGLAEFLAERLPLEPAREVRQQMVLVLVQLGGPMVTAALNSARQSDQAVEVRSQAALGLSHGVGDDLLSLLEELLLRPSGTRQASRWQEQQTDRRLRERAVSLLGQSGAAGAVALLARVLDQTSETGLAQEAADALVSSGPAGIEAVRKAIQRPQEASKTAALVKQLGFARDDASAPALLALLQRSGDNDVQEACAEALGELSASNAVPALSQVIATNLLPQVQSAAAVALGRIGGRPAVDVLLGLLNGRPPAGLRKAAVIGLGLSRDDRAFAALVREVETRGSARLQALEGLGVLDDPRAIPVLTNALADARSDVRAGAAGALGELSAEGGAPALRLAATDRHPQVRKAAVMALGRRQPEPFPKILHQTLQDLDAEVRYEAAIALSLVGDASSGAPLVQALDDRTSNVRFAAAFALGALGATQSCTELTRRVSHADELTRLGAGCGLAFLSRLEALPALEAGARSDNSWHRFIAAIGIVRLGTPAMRLLEPVDDATTPAIAQLVRRIREGQQTRALVPLLSASDSSDRDYAARALAYFVEPAAREALRALAMRPEADERRAARLVLRRWQRAAGPGLRGDIPGASSAAAREN